jgi:hypothetical protein
MLCVEGNDATSSTRRIDFQGILYGVRIERSETKGEDSATRSSAVSSGVKSSFLIYVATSMSELAKQKFLRKAGAYALSCTDRKISKDKSDAAIRLWVIEVRQGGRG